MSAPYNKSIIVSVFVRKAQTQPNPNDFLLNILTGNVDVVTSGDNTVLTSNTTGGTSSNWTIPAAMSRMDIMEITELALRNLETGIDSVPTVDANGNQIMPAFSSVLPSQRIISYAQFGSVRR